MRELNDLGTLDDIMDVEEASKLWGLAPSYIKDLCRRKLEAEGKAIKKGKTWIIERNTPNPGQPNSKYHHKKPKEEKK